MRNIKCLILNIKRSSVPSEKTLNLILLKNRPKKREVFFNDVSLFFLIKNVNVILWCVIVAMWPLIFSHEWFYSILNLMRKI